jgi:hypothetical protein
LFCISAYANSDNANLVTRALESFCDTLIIHPSVVNASDLNDLPENCLCLEASAVVHLLMADISIQPVRSNRVLTIE